MMATPVKVVHVPEPEPGAYNPNRLAGKLLQSQALHLREALIKHMNELAAVISIDPRSLKTEGDIGNYVKKATGILHTHAAVSSGK